MNSQQRLSLAARQLVRSHARRSIKNVRPATKYTPKDEYEYHYRNLTEALDFLRGLNIPRTDVRGVTPKQVIAALEKARGLMGTLGFSVPGK